MKNTQYKIDAKGKKLGRLASEATSILTGKNMTDFAKNKVFDVKVLVENVSKIDIPESRLGKVYRSNSGYPGGLKERTMKQIIEKKGKGALLRMAVLGMIPNNKLKSRIIKNLIIKD